MTTVADVSPKTSFATATFYDPSNNPLNIPCEGPRIIPIEHTTTGDAVSDLLNINMQAMYTSGQFTCLQAIALDTSAFGGNQAVYRIKCAGSNFNILAGFPGGVGQPYPVFNQFPLPAMKSGNLSIDFVGSVAGYQVNIFLFNYMIPPFTSNFQFI